MGRALLTFPLYHPFTEKSRKTACAQKNIGEHSPMFFIDSFSLFFILCNVFSAERIRVWHPSVFPVRTSFRRHSPAGNRGGRQSIYTPGHCITRFFFTTSFGYLPNEHCICRQAVLPWINVASVQKRTSCGPVFCTDPIHGGYRTDLIHINRIHKPGNYVSPPESPPPNHRNGLWTHRTFSSSEPFLFLVLYYHNQFDLSSTFCAFF